MASDIRVLLVENDEYFCDIATSELERDERLTVTQATTSEEALDQLAEEFVDCIVSDYRLPDGDGLAFLRAVRERWPDKPFVLFTVAERAEVAREAIEAGVTEYLQKGGGPHQFDLLRNRIRNAVEANRAATAAKRHRVLLQDIVNTIEDPLFLFDEDGAILLWNDAFREVTGYTDEDAESMGPTGFVADDHASRLLSAIEMILETGSQTFEVDIATKDGDRLPYEISGTVLRNDGQLVGICGTGRDVSERNRRERQLTALNRATRDLLEAQTDTDIASIAVETAVDRLEFRRAVVYLLEETSGKLRAVVGGPPESDGPQDGLTDEAGKTAVIDDENSFAWEAFVEGEVYVEAVGTDTPVRSSEGDLESLEFPPDADDDPVVRFVLPLGEHGIVVVEATLDRVTTEDYRTLAEIHAANVEAALDRAQREHLLRERDRALERQNKQLERRNRINEVLRNVDRAVIRTSTPEELEQQVCEQLADIEPFTFAWIGDVDPIDGSVTPTTHAGGATEILDEFDVTAVDADVHASTNGGAHESANGGAHPSANESGVYQKENEGRTDANTARTDTMDVSSTEIHVVDNLLENRDVGGQQWRNALLKRGYRSAATVPLRHGNAIHGVLQIYAEQLDAFDEETATVLAELGEIVGFAITAANRKHALLTDTVVELDIQIPRENGPFPALTRAAEEVELHSVLPQADGSMLVFFTVAGMATDRVLELANEASEMTDTRLISEGYGRNLFKCKSTDKTVPAVIADHGGEPQTITASTDGITAVVELPKTADVRQFVQTLTTTYPGATVLAQRERPRPERSKPLYERLNARLTSRQWEVLQAAYFSGVFEWPRETTGEEVAEMLGITPPTFHQHLRMAERRLLETVFE